MFGLRRNKIVSIRVNDKLLARFYDIVDSSTEISNYGTIRVYRSKFSRGNYGKFSLSDFVEQSLFDFVNSNESFLSD